MPRGRGPTRAAALRTTTLRHLMETFVCNRAKQDRSALLACCWREIHQSCQPGPMRVGGAEPNRIRLSPFEEQVRRVLPSEPDAAVQLNGFLGGPHGRVGAGCPGQSDLQLRLGDPVIA